MTQDRQTEITEEETVEEGTGETVCYCFDVPDTVIRKVIKEHECTEVEEVTDICDAGGGCTSCHPDIEEMIDEIHG